MSAEREAREGAMERLYVGEWEVFPDLNRIRRGESERHLEPRAMDLLVYLAAHPGEVIAKERIIQAVWSDAFVTDGALTYALGQLRHFLDDDAHRPRYIETIPRRGYRLIAEVRRAGDGAGAAQSATREAGEADGVTPYPGLSPFSERDSPWFFGRDSGVETLWARIRQRPLTAVIGSSGSGKTSFLRAGVIARRPEGWGAGYATPGSQPALGVARAFTADLATEPEAIRELLAGVEELGRSGDPGRMVRTARRWREQWGQGLLVVDQFEELFTLNPPESHARMAALLSGLAGEAGIRVVVSMRDDFLIRCSDHPELADVFEALTPLPMLRHEGLRRALVAPAEARGYRFEDAGLVEEMVDAVAGVRGALPLLAFAVFQLWEYRDRDRRLLTREAYTVIGGVSGALAQHAESTLERIGEQRRPLVRELLRNLVTAQGTRAVMDRDELLSAFSQREEAEAVLGKLVDARLLTTFEVEGPTDGAGRHRVELIHESLLREWPRLVRWQAQDEEGAVLRDQLRQAAHLWHEKNRAEELLWGGTAYREYQLWRERYPGSLTALEEEYCRAMTGLANRRRRRKRWAIASGFGLMVVILAVILSLLQQTEQALDRSVQDERRAQASRLVALGRVELDRFPTAALAYARKSLETADTYEARLLALEALWEGAAARFAPAIEANASRVAFSPDGEYLAAGGFESSLLIWSKQDGGRQQIPGLLAMADPREAMFQPDNSAILTWGVRDPEIRRFDVRGAPLPGISLAAEAVVISGEEGFGALGPPSERNGERKIWTWTSGDLVPREYALWRDPRPPTPDHSGIRPATALEPRLRELAYARGKEIFLHPLPGGPDRKLGAHPQGVRWLTFFADGERLLSADEAGEFVIWSTREGRPVRRAFGPAPQRYGTVAVDPAGRFAGWASSIGPATCIWEFDGPAATPIRCLAENSRNYGSAAVAPDGNWLASVDAQQVTLWPTRNRQVRRLEGHLEGPIHVLRFSPDSETLATGARDGLRLWSLTSREPARHRVDLGDDYFAYSATWTRDGSQVIISANTIGVYLAPAAGGRATRLMPYPAPTVALGEIALSPDGGQVAVTTQYSAQARHLQTHLIDLDTGLVRSVQQKTLDDGKPYSLGVLAIGFRPDGQIALAGFGGVRIWNPALSTLTWLREDPALTCRMAVVSSQDVAFAVCSSDKTGAARWMEDGQLSAINLEDGAAVPLPRYGTRLTGAVAVDDGGRFVATGDNDGVVRVGRIDGGEPHLLPGHGGPVQRVAISPDGRWVASSNGTDIRLWPTPDLDRTPFHLLPYPELMERLARATNLRVVEDPAAAKGYRLELAPFTGWSDYPDW